MLRPHAPHTLLPPTHTHLARRSPAAVSAPDGGWQLPPCSPAGPDALPPAAAQRWPGIPGHAAAPAPAAGPPPSAACARPPLKGNCGHTRPLLAPEPQVIESPPAPRTHARTQEYLAPVPGPLPAGSGGHSAVALHPGGSVLPVAAPVQGSGLCRVGVQFRLGESWDSNERVRENSPSSTLTGASTSP